MDVRFLLLIASVKLKKPKSSINYIGSPVFCQAYFTRIFSFFKITPSFLRDFNQNGGRLDNIEKVSCMELVPYRRILRTICGR